MTVVRSAAAALPACRSSAKGVPTSSRMDATGFGQKVPIRAGGTAPAAGGDAFADDRLLNKENTDRAGILRGPDRTVHCTAPGEHDFSAAVHAADGGLIFAVDHVRLHMGAGHHGVGLGMDVFPVDPQRTSDGQADIGVAEEQTGFVSVLLQPLFQIAGRLHLLLGAGEPFPAGEFVGGFQHVVKG